MTVLDRPSGGGDTTWSSQKNHERLEATHPDIGVRSLDSKKICAPAGSNLPESSKVSALRLVTSLDPNDPLQQHIGRDV